MPPAGDVLATTHQCVCRLRWLIRWALRQRCLCQPSNNLCAILSHCQRGDEAIAVRWPTPTAGKAAARGESAAPAFEPSATALGWPADTEAIKPDDAHCTDPFAGAGKYAGASCCLPTCKRATALASARIEPPP
jgi:hypothetical protein